MTSRFHRFLSLIIPKRSFSVSLRFSNVLLWYSLLSESLEQTCPFISSTKRSLFWLVNIVTEDVRVEFASIAGLAGEHFSNKLFKFFGSRLTVDNLEFWVQACFAVSKKSGLGSNWFNLASSFGEELFHNFSRRTESVTVRKGIRPGWTVGLMLSRLCSNFWSGSR